MQPKPRLQKAKAIKTIAKKSAKMRVKSQALPRAKKPGKARANNSIKAHARKLITPDASAAAKIPQTPAFKTAAEVPKEAASKQAAPPVFPSPAARAHEAIRSFGRSLAEKHNALRSKLLRHAEKISPQKQSAIKQPSDIRACGSKESAAPQKGVMLLNMTKNHMISNKVVFADTAFEKFRGLMFRNRKDVNYALVFDFKKALKDSAAIHMFFVFFPIDVVYLRDSHVVDFHREVKPFTAYLAPKQHADTLIELPQGTIWKSGISIGDEILTTSG